MRIDITPGEDAELPKEIQNGLDQIKEKFPDVVIVIFSIKPLEKITSVPTPIMRCFGMHPQIRYGIEDSLRLIDEILRGYVR